MHSLLRVTQQYWFYSWHTWYLDVQYAQSDQTVSTAHVIAVCQSAVAQNPRLSDICCLSLSVLYNVAGLFLIHCCYSLLFLLKCVPVLKCRYRQRDRQIDK